MTAAENIIDGYRSQHAAKNRTEWNKAHQKLANLLAQVAIQVANAKHD